MERIISLWTVSVQAGWVETDAGTRYLDGNGNQMTGWCVIDGQPYAFGTNGEPKQGWDHSHEKSYYFINGVSQSGTFGEGALSSNLNGSGSVQPVGDQAPEDDLAEDAEGEPPEEELLEAQPTQTETTEAGQTAPAAQQPTQSPGGIGGRAGDHIEGTDSAGNSGTGTAGRRDGKYMKTTRRDFLCLSAMACAWLLTGCQNPTVEERAVSWQQQEVSDPVSETGPMWNAALDDNAVLRMASAFPRTSNCRWKVQQALQGRL